MKIRHYKALTIAVIALAAWLSLSTPAHACDYPNYYEIYYGQDYKYLQSWDPAHDVQFFIDDYYDETDTNQLAHGVTNWNSWRFFDCSYINFVGGQSRHYTAGEYDFDSEPPDYTVWIQRVPTSTSTKIRVGALTHRAIAAKVYITSLSGRAGNQNIPNHLVLLLCCWSRNRPHVRSSRLSYV